MGWTKVSASHRYQTPQPAPKGHRERKYTMSTNNSSPVLDGVWFRPYILKARNDSAGANTDASSTGNSVPPTAPHQVNFTISIKSQKMPLLEQVTTSSFEQED